MTSSAVQSEPLSVGLESRYGRFVRRRALVLAGLVLATVGALLLDLASGASGLGLADLLVGILDPQSLSRAEQVIVWQVRLPTALMAVLVGAALGLAGAEMQTVLNNPLASPFTLGVAAAATLGAALAIAFDLALPGFGPDLAISGAAFAFALAATLAVQVLAHAYRADTGIVVLFGIALYFALNACEWLVHLVSTADASQQIVFWTMGSFARANWDKLAIVVVALAVCLPFSLRRAWAMTALRGGEEHAASLGIQVGRLRLGALFRVGLLTAVAVAFVGEIGFVGLVGPHIARLALGEDHRFYLPGSALAGALLLALASVASKTLVPGMILPVGIVTALVGIPLFIALILTQRRPR